MRENVSWLFFNADCILIVGVNEIYFYIDIRMTSFNVYTICTNIEIIVGNGNVTSSYIYSWTITVSNNIVTYNGIFSNMNNRTTCINIRIWNNIFFYNWISSCINSIVPTIIICISSNERNVVSLVSLSAMTYIPSFKDRSFGDPNTKVCFAIFPTKLQKDEGYIGKNIYFLLFCSYK